MIRTRSACARSICAWGALATALVAVPSVASAQSEDRLSADVSATAGYSNNPFSFNDDDSGSALVGVDVSPVYQVLTANSTFTASGTASVQQYLRRYGRNDSYSGAVDYQLRPSERVTAHGRIDLSSAVLGNFNGYAPAVVGTGVGTGVDTGTGTVVPVTPVVTTPTTGTGFVPLPDIGLYGFRNRRKLARASADVSMQLSERDSLTVSGYGEATRYSRIQQFGNYEAYSGSIGYSRRLSDRVSAGVRGSASFYNYKERNGDSRVFPVEATVTARLSQFWTLDGALGATFISNDAIGSTSKTSLSGNANLCRRGELSTMCLFGSRQASPTGLVGTQYVTSGGVSWSRRLGERENLSLSGSYTKVGGDDTRLVQNGVVVGGLPIQNEYAQATIGYDRQISQRLRFVASANYNKLFGNGDNRPDNYGGQVGLAYHFGDLR